MHKGWWRWDAGHSWAVNNTRVNHPRVLSHTQTHMRTVSTDILKCIRTSVCICPAHTHTQTHRHATTQSEHNVYWWCVSKCVKWWEAVHQVAVAVVSSRAWSWKAQPPECNLLFTTHTYTYLCAILSSHICQHLRAHAHRHSHKVYSQFSAPILTYSCSCCSWARVHLPLVVSSITFSVHFFFGTTWFPNHFSSFIRDAVE